MLIILLVSYEALSNEWDKTIIDTTSGSYPEITGLKIDTMNYPHIAYNNYDGDLRYVKWNGIDWVYEKVTDSVGKSNLRGSKFALDNQGYPHFAKSREITSRISTLEYFYKDYSGWNLQIDTFQIYSYEYYLSVLSLDTDSLGYPHLLIHDRVIDWYEFDCCYEEFRDSYLTYISFDGEEWNSNWGKYFYYHKISCGSCMDDLFRENGTTPGNGSLILNSRDSANILYTVNDYSSNTRRLNLLCPDSTYLIREGGTFTSANLDINSSDIPYISYYVPADAQLYVVKIIDDTSWPVDTIKLYGSINNNSIKSDIAPDNKSYFLYNSDFLLKLSWKDDNDTCKYCIIDTISNIISSDFSIDNEGRFHAVIISKTGDYKTIYYYTADSILNAYSFITQPDTQPVVIADFLLNISQPVTNRYINIQYEIPAPSEISCKIYDSMGRTIKAFSEEKDAGASSLRIDLLGNTPGIYFIKVEIGPLQRTKKILLLK